MFSHNFYASFSYHQESTLYFLKQSHVHRTSTSFYAFTLFIFTLFLAFHIPNFQREYFILYDVFTLSSLHVKLCFESMHNSVLSLGQANIDQLANVLQRIRSGLLITLQGRYVDYRVSFAQLSRDTPLHVDAPVIRRHPSPVVSLRVSSHGRRLRELGEDHTSKYNCFSSTECSYGCKYNGTRVIPTLNWCRNCVKGQVHWKSGIQNCDCLVIFVSKTFIKTRGMVACIRNKYTLIQRNQFNPKRILSNFSTCT